VGAEADVEELSLEAVAVEAVDLVVMQEVAERAVEVGELVVVVQDAE